MPKDLTENIKTFLLYLRGDEKTKTKPIAKSVIIKTKHGRTKFKLRCPRYLYTLKIDEPGKAEKIKSSIPTTIKKVEINDKGKKEDKKQAAQVGKKLPQKKAQ